MLSIVLRGGGTVIKVGARLRDPAMESCSRSLAAASLAVPVLPEEDLLNGSRGGVSLREHGHHDVGLEVPARLDLLHDALRNLPGDGVHGLRVPVVEPGVGAAQEVLQGPDSTENGYLS